MWGSLFENCNAAARSSEPKKQPPLNLPEGRLAASEEPKKKIEKFSPENS